MRKGWVRLSVSVSTYELIVGVQLSSVAGKRNDALGEQSTKAN